MTSELDPKARQLIGLAMQGERRLPRHRERVRRGVLAAVAAPVALSATEGALAATKGATVGTAALGGTAAGSKAAFGVALWLKLAPLVVVTVAAGVVSYERVQAPPRRPAAPLVVAPVVSVVPAPAAEELEIEPFLEAEPTPSEPVAPPAAKPNKAALRSAAEPASPVAVVPPSLSSELEALQRAQRALNSGDAGRALAELDSVKGRALAAERTALEVFALCRLGNTAAARRKAALFRQLAPESPLLARVNASCAGE